MTQSLPDAAEQVAAAEKESALVRIIDDEIDVREALALMLRIEGWTAKTYPNARAFLIEDDVRRPGCLVLDVRMPLMTGLELQNEMLRRGLMLPTIFLTGHADIDVAVSSLKRGAVDFLIKPVNDEILLESIAAAVHCDFLRRAGVAGGEGVRERLRLLRRANSTYWDIFLTARPMSRSQISFRFLNVRLRDIEPGYTANSAFTPLKSSHC